MSVFIDADYLSLNKYKEELCGDKVEIIRNEDSTIIVLADGLGSGVKANILATLTSKIIGTMLSMGASIEEAVETIINTLPICREREIAYSTFTILQVYKSGECYLVEFDNPAAITLKGGKYCEHRKECREINGKLVKESRFFVTPDDVIILMSDGAVHAGVGQCLNLGWKWENIKDYMERAYTINMPAKNISKTLLTACNNLYANKPGDDTTVVTVKIRNYQQLSVIVGPPVDRDMDEYVINKFISSKGKKVVCGGTTSQIVSRITGKEIETSINYVDPSVPPIAKIEGIDLTTEGVLTMSKALEYIKKYIASSNSVDEYINLGKQDGASRLTRMLVEESTAVNFFVGRAINPAHQNPDFPMDLNMKLKLVNDMKEQLVSLGKKVNIEYY